MLVLDLVARAGVLWLLYTGLLAFAAWAGHAALHPGAWLEGDQGLYVTLNGPNLRPLTDVLFTLLNDPGPAYFAVIVVLLGYCGWRRRAALPAAAVAVGVALALGQAATREVHHAGNRERPFVGITAAQTPIAACSGPALLTRRGAAGPTASCDGSPATMTGLDWRTIWVQFPSFPSGHMRETAALSLLLAGFWRASWPFALAYVLLMGFSRVHLGAHFPSDVLGGTLLGAWAAAIVLLGLDAIRRALRLAYRVPPVRTAWNWVALTRTPGRPDLDPPLARLLRVGVVVGVAFLTLYVLGFALVSGNAGQLYSVLQNADYSAFGFLTYRFDPGLGRTLYLALGPAGLAYAALALAVLVVPLALQRAEGRRGAAFAALSLGATVGLALALQVVGSQWFQRPQPFNQVAEAPIPAEWRAAWQAATSFPNWHVLLISALAGLLLPLGRPAALAGQAVALAATVTAVYSGASWLTDALASYALGLLAAAVARYAVRQVLPPPGAPPARPALAGPLPSAGPALDAVPETPSVAGAR